MAGIVVDLEITWGSTSVEERIEKMSCLDQGSTKFTNGSLDQRKDETFYRGSIG